ncbi:MAG TPA: alpha/beta hydrolase, partial [Stackebrandtia sp.]|uniref:alpha/beta fold hydrolase n=1 Tax=Stackebrandtia sp. TaxID=2023065 RepID=UPI002D248FB9
MLHHVEHGTGTPVLALHGWPVDHRLMTGCLEPVFARREGYRRLYPDLPGMGASPADGIDSSDDMLGAIGEFIDEHIGDEPFLVVGESYGGYLARGLLQVRRSQVSGMALICPVGRELRNQDRTVPPRTVLVDEPGLVEALDAETAADFTAVAVVRTSQTLRRFTADIKGTVYDEAALERIKRRWELSMLPERGEPYECPGLILTGRQDWATGYADVYALLDHYPRASFAILDRGGHNLQIEQPELFEAMTLEWLDRVAEAG